IVTQHSSNDTLKLTKKICANPKNTLQQLYENISQKLNDAKLKPYPKYTMIKVNGEFKTWCCTYKLKWPCKLKEIEEVASSKREASKEAAFNTLLWLRNNEKITESGHPIITKVVSETKRLNIDSDTLLKIKAIIKEYQKGIIPKTVKENLDDVRLLQSVSDEIKINRSLKQRYFGRDQYLAKEKYPLPITAYKDQIIDLLKKSRVVIIKGQPGCGKSSYLPQYALETWVKTTKSHKDVFRIAVTQPRRIAAMSLAEHVSSERNEECGFIVGYQIRLKCNFNKSTGRILYCTTGILLRHLQSDPTLENFPCVILDEAHERDANTDLLMKLLRRSLILNPRLKLIIMSATIDTDLFKNYFNGAPVLVIDGFNYPVQAHFLDNLTNIDLKKTKNMCRTPTPTVVHEDVVKVIMYIHRSKSDDGTILCFLPGWDDICRIQNLIPLTNDLMVLRLHSRLQDSDQWKIFWPSNPGVRKVILATNIAETSVTINDVVYVVDTGIHKESRFDDEQGIVCLDNQWISQANMIQRKGRAGRVQPGESFHLYTKSRYDSMSRYTDPEISKISLSKIVLDSKAFYGGGDAWEFMSNLPTPPKFTTVKKAVEELKDLELLNDGENLTALGKILAHFQLHPKLAKTLVNAIVFKCVTPVVDIVTIFSSEIDIFNNALSDKYLMRDLKSKTGFENSDHLALMILFEYWLEFMEDHDEQMAVGFCFETNLNHSSLIMLKELRKIHFGYLHNGLHNSVQISDEYSDNNELVKAVLLSGLGTLFQLKNQQNKLLFITSNGHEATITSESVNYKKTKLPSDFLVYITEIRSVIRKTNVIRECSTISALALLLFSRQELTVDKISNEELVLGLNGTTVKFLCTNEIARDLQKCKTALKTVYQYYINQLTQSGQFDPEINKTCDKILNYINE
ncbi:HA2, DEAD, Dicer dimer, and/or OB NTP bind domain containing protein, partial [Asbolus verrucosus]